MAAWSWASTISCRWAGPDSGFWSYRFRPEKDRFRLIGYEAEKEDRRGNNQTTISINYLTGKVIVTRDGDDYKTPEKTVTKLKSKAPVMIEDVGDGLAFEPGY